MKPNESFISQPVRSLQTMLRVIAEDDPRQPTVVPDGIYGPTTMEAVTAFQRRYGIPVTGIADQNTFDNITEQFELALTRVGKAEPIEILLAPGQVLRLGDDSPYIFLLQSMLTQLSLDHAMIEAPGHSGTLDSTTARSLRGFQQLAGLEETGELDRVTWRDLSRQFTLNAHRNHRVRNNR